MRNWKKLEKTQGAKIRETEHRESLRSKKAENVTRQLAETRKLTQPEKPRAAEVPSTRDQTPTTVVRESHVPRHPTTSARASGEQASAFDATREAAQKFSRVTTKHEPLSKMPEAPLHSARVSTQGKVKQALPAEAKVAQHAPLRPGERVLTEKNILPQKADTNTRKESHVRADKQHAPETDHAARDAQAAVVAGGTEAARGAVRKDESKREGIEKREREPRETQRAAGGHGATAHRGLKSLETGVSSTFGESSGDGDAQTALSDASAASLPELPQFDPDFHLIDEESHIGKLKSTARVFGKYVEKRFAAEERLRQISTWDFQLTAGLVSLCERCVTDDENLKMKTHDFLNSVYGKGIFG